MVNNYQFQIKFNSFFYPSTRTKLLELIKVIKNCNYIIIIIITYNHTKL